MTYPYSLLPTLAVTLYNRSLGLLNKLYIFSNRAPRPCFRNSSRFSNTTKRKWTEHHPYEFYAWIWSIVNFMLGELNISRLVTCLLTVTVSSKIVFMRAAVAFWSRSLTNQTCTFHYFCVLLITIFC